MEIKVDSDSDSDSDKETTKLQSFYREKLCRMIQEILLKLK
jgi:hypothetical protein